MKPTPGDPHGAKPTQGEEEAFLSIVEHKGINPAARAGCGHASWLSKCAASLEAKLETTLFSRSDFQLTRHGRIYHEALAQAAELRGRALAQIAAETRPALRVVSWQLAAQDFLPAIMRQVAARHPGIEWSTESGNEEQMRDMLRRGDVNLAIAPVHDGWRGFSRVDLMKLHPVLICAANSALRSAGDLWGQGDIKEPLLVSASLDSLTQVFDEGVRGLKATWKNRLRVATAQCVATGVAEGDGIGLTADVPNLVNRPGIRRLPLPHFAPIQLAAFYRGKPTAAHSTIIELLQIAARELESPAADTPKRPAPEKTLAKRGQGGR